MKTKPDDNEDKTLRALLHEWNPPSTLPPRFKDHVWHRIERAELESPPFLSRWESLAGWIVSMLPRPAFATAYVTLLLLIGAGAGWKEARQDSAKIAADLGFRYVQSVDPYQATP